MGLLSLMESEGVDKVEHGWWEKRAINYEAVTATAVSDGPFTNTSGTDLTVAGWSRAIDTSIRIYLSSADNIRVRDTIFIYQVPGTGAAQDIVGRVTAVDTANDYITVVLTQAVSNALNGTAEAGLYVTVTGSAVPEASNWQGGVYHSPVEITNYIGIHREGFSFSGSAAKIGQRFDSSGLYQETSNDAGYRYNIGAERKLFWGVRHKETTGITNEESEDSVIHHMGGLLWFLRQWELGNTSNGGKFDYRPGGTNVTSSAWATTNDKRVIDVNGNLTGDQFDMLIARVFSSHTSDKGFEKMLFCGHEFLQYFTKYVERKGIATRQYHAKTPAGFTVTVWESPFGTVLIKTHPLFNESVAWRKSAFIIDTGDLKFIYQNDRDMNINPNIQLPGYDGRKDEWFGTLGLECKFPEGMMFIYNVTGMTV